jgi:hypothetical protein
MRANSHRNEAKALSSTTAPRLGRRSEPPLKPRDSVCLHERGSCHLLESLVGVRDNCDRTMELQSPVSSAVAVLLEIHIHWPFRTTHVPWEHRELHRAPEVLRA